MSEPFENPIEPEYEYFFEEVNDNGELIYYQAIDDPQCLTNYYPIDGHEYIPDGYYIDEYIIETVDDVNPEQPDATSLPSTSHLDQTIDNVAHGEEIPHNIRKKSGVTGSKNLC